MTNRHFLPFAVLLFLGLTSLPAFCDEGAASSETTVTAEGRSPDRFVRRVIFEGSFTNAGYEGADAGRYSQPNGYSAGVLFDLIGSRRLVLETGVLYRQFGTTYNDGLGDNSLTANYISVPIDMKYYLSGQEVSSLFVKAGVMGSTLISKNTLYETPTTRIRARSWETAFLAGLGIKVNLSSASDLILEADYSRSIDSVFSNARVYRSDLSAGLGFAINM